MFTMRKGKAQWGRIIWIEVVILNKRISKKYQLARAISLSNKKMGIKWKKIIRRAMTRIINSLNKTQLSMIYQKSTKKAKII